MEYDFQDEYKNLLMQRDEEQKLLMQRQHLPSLEPQEIQKARITQIADKSGYDEVGMQRSFNYAIGAMILAAPFTGGKSLISAGIAFGIKLGRMIYTPARNSYFAQKLEKKIEKRELDIDKAKEAGKNIETLLRRKTPQEIEAIQEITINTSELDEKQITQWRIT